MENTLKFKKFTDLEKQVIRAWCNIIKGSSDSLDAMMHQAVTYYAVEAIDLSQESQIPTKKLRGVLSSLVKKDVFYEDLIQGDSWFSPEKPAFLFGDYFCKDNYDGNQIDDCNMEKVYDAIK